MLHLLNGCHDNTFVNIEQGMQHVKEKADFILRWIHECSYKFLPYGQRLWR